MIIKGWGSRKISVLKMKRWRFLCAIAWALTLSRDPQNQEQIWLIRQHLEQMAENFIRRDYTGPESIHGQNMPGLAEMRSAQSGSLQITYSAEPSGASLTFHANNALFIKAIHEGFDAQVQDHGHDAMEIHRRHHP